MLQTRRLLGVWWRQVTSSWVVNPRLISQSKLSWTDLLNLLHRQRRDWRRSKLHLRSILMTKHQSGAPPLSTLRSQRRSQRRPATWRTLMHQTWAWVKTQHSVDQAPRKVPSRRARSSCSRNTKRNPIRYMRKVLSNLNGGSMTWSIIRWNSSQILRPSLISSRVWSLLSLPPSGFNRIPYF